MSNDTETNEDVNCKMIPNFQCRYNDLLRAVSVEDVGIKPDSRVLSNNERKGSRCSKFEQHSGEAFL